MSDERHLTRLRLLRIDDATRRDLRDAATVLGPHMDRVIAAFYDFVRATPGMREKFPTDEAIRRAGQAQKIHWMQNLFSGNWDERYVAAVEQQGAATAEISRAVQKASTNAAEVSSVVRGTREVSGQTIHAASDVMGAAGELARQSAFLRAKVDDFLTRIRAA